MSIKTILVPMDGSDGAARALDTALVVARRFDSHIKAVHVMQQPEEAAPFMFDRLSQKLRETVLHEAEEDARERAAEVRKQFDDFCAANGLTQTSDPSASGVSVSWVEEFGPISETLVRHARAADAVTMARPAMGAAAGKVRRAPVGRHLEELLLRCGRPVVLVPPQWQARRVEHAAIGWNESLEASRALAMTIPWLAQMQKVTVLVSRKREAGTGLLLEYLARHGVKASVNWLETKRESVGEAMLATCRREGAELLVVGGFSHSRSRQLLFGGVTQHLLTHSEIVTVMVH